MPTTAEHCIGERQIVADLRERLGAGCAPDGVLLFGPRTRGDQHADLDLCLIYPSIDNELRAFIEQLAWEVGFDHGVTICPLLVSCAEFADPAASPLFERIRHEGMPV